MNANDLRDIAHGLHCEPLQAVFLAEKGFVNFAAMRRAGVGLTDYGAWLQTLWAEARRSRFFQERYRPEIRDRDLVLDYAMNRAGRKLDVLLRAA
jgi:hypothetical protein